MGERTIRVTCRDCGTVFEHATRSNKPKLLCDTCREAARLESTRKYTRTQRAVAGRQHRTCLDCPADLTGSPGRRLRCEPCVVESRREYQRVLRESLPKPTGREFFCVRCAVKIDRVGNSGRPLYCATHAGDASRESAVRSESKRTAGRGARKAEHCHYCGGALRVPYYPGKYPARCALCKARWHRDYMRARTAEHPRGYDHVRRARKMGLGYERFTVLEVFERDRWRCGICRERISRRLRYPHPFSASLDHKIPLAKGGPHSRRNTQAAHLRCNLRKRVHVAPLGEQIPLAL